MPDFLEIQNAFKSTTLSAYSFPLPVGYSLDQLPSALKEADVNKKQGILTAYMTVYCNDDGSPFVDPYNDIIEPGAFTKTISELDQSRNKKHNPWLVPDLWQHDRNELIGGILKLGEDSKGVIYECQFAMGVQRGREALDLAELKMLGSSYGYDPIRFDILPGNVRSLKENRLREISQVTFPANDLAPILGTKQHWGWSHVPQQAATLFDNLSQSVKQDGKSDITPTIKARDFNTVWQARQISEVYNDLYHMVDCLMSSVTDIVSDDSVTDEAGELSATVSQFSSKLTTDWLADYEACEMDSGDSYYGDIMQAGLSTIALKEINKSLATKAGKVLSSENHGRIASAIASVSSELSQIQSWLDALEENADGKSLTQKPTSHTAPVVPNTSPVTPPVSAPTLPASTTSKEVATNNFLQEVQALFRSAEHNAPHSTGIS